MMLMSRLLVYALLLLVLFATTTTNFASSSDRSNVAAAATASTASASATASSSVHQTSSHSSSSTSSSNVASVNSNDVANNKNYYLHYYKNGIFELDSVLEKVFIRGKLQLDIQSQFFDDKSYNGLLGVLEGHVKQWSFVEVQLLEPTVDLAMPELLVPLSRLSASLIVLAKVHILQGQNVEALSLLERACPLQEMVPLHITATLKRQQQTLQLQQQQQLSSSSSSPSSLSSPSSPTSSSSSQQQQQQQQIQQNPNPNPTANGKQKGGSSNPNTASGPSTIHPEVLAQFKNQISNLPGGFPPLAHLLQQQQQQQGNNNNNNNNNNMPADPKLSKLDAELMALLQSNNAFGQHVSGAPFSSDAMSGSDVCYTLLTDVYNKQYRNSASSSSSTSSSSSSYDDNTDQGYNEEEGEGEEEEEEEEDEYYSDNDDGSFIDEDDSSNNDDDDDYFLGSGPVDEPLEFEDDTIEVFGDEDVVVGSEEEEVYYNGDDDDFYNGGLGESEMDLDDRSSSSSSPSSSLSDISKSSPSKLSATSFSSETTSASSKKKLNSAIFGILSEKGINIKPDNLAKASKILDKKKRKQQQHSTTTSSSSVSSSHSRNKLGRGESGSESLDDVTDGHDDSARSVGSRGDDYFDIDNHINSIRAPYSHLIGSWQYASVNNNNNNNINNNNNNNYINKNDNGVPNNNVNVGGSDGSSRKSNENFQQPQKWSDGFGDSHNIPSLGDLVPIDRSNLPEALRNFQVIRVGTNRGVMSESLLLDRGIIRYKPSDVIRCPYTLFCSHIRPSLYDPQPYPDSRKNEGPVQVELFRIGARLQFYINLFIESLNKAEKMMMATEEEDKDSNQTNIDSNLTTTSTTKAPTADTVQQKLNHRELDDSTHLTNSSRDYLISIVNTTEKFFLDARSERQGGAPLDNSIDLQIESVTIEVMFDIISFGFGFIDNELASYVIKGDSSVLSADPHSNVMPDFFNSNFIDSMPKQSSKLKDFLAMKDDFQFDFSDEEEEAASRDVPSIRDSIKSGRETGISSQSTCVSSSVDNRTSVSSCTDDSISATTSPITPAPSNIMYYNTQDFITRITNMKLKAQTRLIVLSAFAMALETNYYVHRLNISSDTTSSFYYQDTSGSASSDYIYGPKGLCKKMLDSVENFEIIDPRGDPTSRLNVIHPNLAVGNFPAGNGMPGSSSSSSITGKPNKRDKRKRPKIDANSDFDFGFDSEFDLGSTSAAAAGGGDAMDSPGESSYDVEVPSSSLTKFNFFVFFLFFIMLYYYLTNYYNGVRKSKNSLAVGGGSAVVDSKTASSSWPSLFDGIIKLIRGSKVDPSSITQQHQSCGLATVPGGSKIGGGVVVGGNQGAKLVNGNGLSLPSSSNGGSKVTTASASLNTSKKSSASSTISSSSSISVSNKAAAKSLNKSDDRDDGHDIAPMMQTLPSVSKVDSSEEDIASAVDAVCNNNMYSSLSDEPSKPTPIEDSDSFISVEAVAIDSSIPIIATSTLDKAGSNQEVCGQDSTSFIYAQRESVSVEEETNSMLTTDSASSSVKDALSDSSTVAAVTMSHLPKSALKASSPKISSPSAHSSISSSSIRGGDGDHHLTKSVKFSETVIFDKGDKAHLSSKSSSSSIPRSSTSSNSTSTSQPASVVSPSPLSIHIPNGLGASYEQQQQSNGSNASSYNSKYEPSRSSDFKAVSSLSSSVSSAGSGGISGTGRYVPPVPSNNNVDQARSLRNSVPSSTSSSSSAGVGTGIKTISSSSTSVGGSSGTGSTNAAPVFTVLQRPKATTTTTTNGINIIQNDPTFDKDSSSKDSSSKDSSSKKTKTGNDINDKTLISTTKVSSKASTIGDVGSTRGSAPVAKDQGSNIIIKTTSSSGSSSTISGSIQQQQIGAAESVPPPVNSVKVGNVNLVGSSGNISGGGGGSTNVHVAHSLPQHNQTIVGPESVSFNNVSSTSTSSTTTTTTTTSSSNNNIHNNNNNNNNNNNSMFTFTSSSNSNSISISNTSTPQVDFFGLGASLPLPGLPSIDGDDASLRGGLGGGSSGVQLDSSQVGIGGGVGEFGLGGGGEGNIFGSFFPSSTSNSLSAGSSLFLSSSSGSNSSLASNNFDFFGSNSSNLNQQGGGNLGYGSQLPSLHSTFGGMSNDLGNLRSTLNFNNFSSSSSNLFDFQSDPNSNSSLFHSFSSDPLQDSFGGLQSSSSHSVLSSSFLPPPSASISNNSNNHNTISISSSSMIAGNDHVKISLLCDCSFQPTSKIKSMKVFTNYCDPNSQELSHNLKQSKVNSASWYLDIPFPIVMQKLTYKYIATDHDGNEWEDDFSKTSRIISVAGVSSHEITREDRVESMRLRK